jgi:hypothetical protein
MAEDITRSEPVSAPHPGHGAPQIDTTGSPGPKKPHRGDVTIGPLGTPNSHPGSNPTPKSK